MSNHNDHAVPKLTEPADICMADDRPLALNRRLGSSDRG